MKQGHPLSVLPWLVRDTFRQALSSGVFWLMLGVTAVCVAACLTVREVPASVEELEAVRLSARQRVAIARATTSVVSAGFGQSLGVWPVPGTLYSSAYRKAVTFVARPVSAPDQLELAFGAIRVPINGERATAVRGVEVQLAAWIADTVGLLLALTWTAGFLPTFLEAGAVVVLLAKPVPRWVLLAGKFGGVVLFMAFQTLTFVSGTWLALALRTGVWDMTYFRCVPVLLLHFAVFFSFSVMLAVVTRSTVACVFGSIVFWLFCCAMNFGRHAILLMPDFQHVAPGFLSALEVLYWVLPKPLDFHEVLVDTLQARNPVGQLMNVQGLSARGAWLPGLSLLASALCAVALLSMAAYEFLTAEY